MKKYWFTTQDPKVLEYSHPYGGVWVRPRFKVSGNAIQPGDMVVVYEVGENRNHTVMDGAKAVVAIARVVKLVEEEPDEDGFLRIAETELTTKSEEGIPAKRTLSIMKGVDISTGDIGLILHRDYAAKLTEISSGVFTTLNRLLNRL